MKLMRVVGRGVLGLATTGSLLAQSAPARPEFEVASVKPAVQAPAGTQVHVGVQIDGAQVHCTYLSLKDYIRIAYQVKDFQIMGPDWIPSERYDIHAKLPEGGRDQLREMLKTLLEQRFQMKMHRATKEFPVYGLTVNKNALKLKESPLDPLPEGTEGGRGGAVNVTATGGRGGTTVNYGRGAYFTLADNKFEVRKLSMDILAEALGRFVDRPVVDMTDLKGTYDLTVEFTPEDYRAMLIRMAMSAGVNLPPEAMKLLEGTSDEALFKGLEKLGLKLENRKAPLEVLVVDSATKTPIEN